jgi:hypothetical protein
MKFSVFTPSHNLKDIDRPLKSLLNQTFKDFEWVLLLNGDALSEEMSIREKLVSAKIDFQILHEFSGNENIGYLKKTNCKSATGEILVELDHDDELMPNCLEELSKAFEQGYDFCYSDDYYVQLEDDKEVYIAPFSPQWGWKVKEDKKGRKYHPSFDPSPSSFSFIWYAPDHVRAWRRDFYEKIGGHDESLEVCDDYELMCRTYIRGKCHRIPKPLYKYFAAPERTSAAEKNEKIQELTHQVHDNYMLGLASTWADQQNLKKVDLCSGGKVAEDFIGIDKNPGNEIVFDLNEPNWPFEDGSVGVFRAWNAVSYLKDPVHTMSEIYRCLSDYGWAIIDVLSTDGRGAFQDPLNVSYWNTNSFWYYTKSDFARQIGTPVKFQLNRIDNYYPSQFEEFHNMVYARAHLMKLPEKGFDIPIHGREV